MALKTLAKKTVSSTANTATQLTATQTYAHSIYILASSDNAADIWIGDSNVSNGLIGAARGIRLAASGTYTEVIESSPNALDLSTVYLISSSTSAAVYVSYTET